MELLIKRRPSSMDHMHGDLFTVSDAGAQSWLCHTLEDEAREVKVPGETAIPAGRYEIRFRPFGESRLDARYADRFPFYKGQLWLQDVPNFTYVYMHCGNTDDHTDGCPLLGLTRYASSIGRSRDAYRKVYPLLASAMGDGEKVFVTIIDA